MTEDRTVGFQSDWSGHQGDLHRPEPVRDPRRPTDHPDQPCGPYGTSHRPYGTSHQPSDAERAATRPGTVYRSAASWSTDQHIGTGGTGVTPAAGGTGGGRQGPRQPSYGQNQAYGQNRPTGATGDGPYSGRLPGTVAPRRSADGRISDRRIVSSRAAGSSFQRDTWSGRRRALIVVAGAGLLAAACGKAATTQGVKDAMKPFVDGLVSPTPVPTPTPTHTPTAPVEPPSIADASPVVGQPFSHGQMAEVKQVTTAGKAEAQDRDSSYMRSAPGRQIAKNTPTSGQQYTGVTAAAGAVTVPAGQTVLATNTSQARILHLLRRTTFGPMPGSVAEVVGAGGMDAWISQQLNPKSINDSVADSVVSKFQTLDMNVEQLRALDKSNADNRPDPQRQLGQATLARQIWSRRQLFEVMADFWNDFLHIASPHDRTYATRSSFDEDVIRKFALGRYSDMFLAANRHPALLQYLNQDQSRKDAINENLGRENLELYSVSVRTSVYTETDVRQASILQTGRTVKDDKYVYDPDRHVTGPVKIMGFSHPNSSAQGGEAAQDEYFKYLATHPATAEHIAYKLAVHFVSDAPPASLINRLKDVYLKNNTAIVPVLMALFSSSEFWASVGQKASRPRDYVVAVQRAVGVEPGTDPKKGVEGLYWKLRQLGHAPLDWSPPNGFPKVFVAWASASALLEEWDEALAAADGWRKELAYTEAEKLLGSNPPKTAGAYVDAMTQLLTGQKFSAAHRSALLTFLDATEGTAIDKSNIWKSGMLARLVLSSPYKVLR